MRTIRIITPSEALAWLKGFNARVTRLEANDYSIPRLRTEDMNKLRYELKSVREMASIAVHNKNKERAAGIVGESHQKFKSALAIREEERNKEWAYTNDLSPEGMLELADRFENGNERN